MIFADEAIAERHADVQLELAKQVGMAAERVGRNFAPSFGLFGGIPATFCGDGSPLTQANVTSAKQVLTLETYLEISYFYANRAVNFELNLSPFTPIESWETCHRQGWKIVEHENLLYLEKDMFHSQKENDFDVTSSIGKPSLNYTETISRGFFGDDFNDDMQISAIISATESSYYYLASKDSKPMGAGSLVIAGTTGFLGGMSTLPESRNQGVQSALISARVRDSFDSGCDLILVSTTPGSGSQRNMERAGFRVAYTRSQFGRS